MLRKQLRGKKTNGLLCHGAAVQCPHNIAHQPDDGKTVADQVMHDGCQFGSSSAGAVEEAGPFAVFPMKRTALLLPDQAFCFSLKRSKGNRRSTMSLFQKSTAVRLHPQPA